MQMIDRLQVKRDGLVETMGSIVRDAENETRDLSDDEMATRAAAMEDIAGIDRQLESLSDRFIMETGLAEKVRSVGRTRNTEDFSYRSGGEALFDLLHQGEVDSKERYAVSMRAAEHMGTLASHTVATAGDLGGLSIVKGVGAIIDPYPGASPFLTALGTSRIPSAAFSRPYIDDPDFKTAAGKQSKEKAELLSKAFTVGSENLVPETVGSFLNVSQQLVLLQPGSLDVIIKHLRKRLGWAMESALLAELANTTGAAALAAAGTPADVQKVIYEAAAAVMKATREPASFILMGPDGFALLGGMADLAARPIFPTLGATNAGARSTANAFTSEVFGLSAVVTPAIDDTTLYIGNGAGIEAWTYPIPLMEAVEPSVLGRQIAVAAMIAPYRPKGMENSVVKVTVS